MKTLDKGGQNVENNICVLCTSVALNIHIVEIHHPPFHLCTLLIVSCVRLDNGQDEVCCWKEYIIEEIYERYMLSKISGFDIQ